MPRSKKSSSRPWKARARRNALEHAGFSQSHWTEPDDDQPDLAGLRFATTSYRDVQAVARSATDRESARHRRSVYEPARSRAGLVCGGEEPDSGTGPHATAAPVTARTIGTRHA